MALVNISLVTEALKTLIREHLDARFQATVTATAAAPSSQQTGTNIVNVHLYHVVEDPFYKNADAPFARGDFPIRQTPLALVLNYAISAFTDTSDEDGSAIIQQALLGYIAKTLHDFPVLTDATVAGDPPVQVFPDLLRERQNRIELTLKPTPIEESINFWSAQQESLTRLSLYVEVRVIMLETEEPEQAAGIVLTVGNPVITGGGPELTASRSVITFTLPTPAALPQQVRLSPARVALFGSPPDPPSIPADNNRVTLDGTGLSPGRRFLLLRREGFRARVNLDQPLVEQPAENQAWEFRVTPSGVTFRVRRSLFDFGTAGVVLLAPGTFGARIVIEDDRIRTLLPRSSNELAFSVIPQILTVTNTGPDTYELTIVSNYLQDTDIEVELSLGKRFLALVTAAPLAGQFQVTSASTITFVRPAPLPGEGAEPLPLPVRLIVNGAIATPAWITV